MNTTNILTHNLNDFIEELRFADYNIGTAQFLAVQRLILALIEQNALPTESDKLSILLSPILCRSPKEQDDFKGYFDDWISRAEEIAATETTPTPSKVAATETTRPPLKDEEIAATETTRPLLKDEEIAATETTRTPLKKPTFLDKISPSRRPQWQWLMLFIITGIMGFFVYYGVDILELIPQTTATPLPDVQPGGNLPWGAVAILLGLALYFMPWKFLRRRLVQRYLIRKAVTEYPELKNLSVTLAEKSIFQPLKNTAQQLRKHINRPSFRLDVKATIEKTIEAANYFTPVTGTTKTRPEYLALIDRTTFNDHQAALVTVLIKELLNESVFVVPYYFDGEPRRCYAPSQFAFLKKGGQRLEMIQKGEYTVVTLPELVARYPEYHLMIFSDGQHFIDRTTGQLADWVKQFYDWSHRSLFTLANPNEWGYLERILATDFLVMPANEAGLRALVEYSCSKAEALDGNFNALGGNFNALDGNFKYSKRKARFPELLYERSHRWIESCAPEPEILADLLPQLKSFLSEKGYYWFGACAVYPELHWQLTLYLGDTLNCAIEKNLGKLARLPWFREGYMPNWLRELLIADLLPEQRKEINAALEALLFKKNKLKQETPKMRFELPIALEPAISLRQRKHEDSPLKEYVFVTFFWDNLAVKLSHPILLFSELTTKPEENTETPKLQLKTEEKPKTPKLQLKTFAFEVVTVNKKGEIVTR
jgi:hypothetical protein